MIEVYKILHNIYKIEITQGLLQFANNTRTRGHSLKLVTQSSRIEIRRNSFTVRVVVHQAMEFVTRGSYNGTNC